MTAPPYQTAVDDDVFAQDIFQQQAPWVAISHADVMEAVRKNVLNYRSDPFGRHIFYPVGLAANGE